MLHVGGPEIMFMIIMLYQYLNVLDEQRTICWATVIFASDQTEHCMTGS